MLLLWEKFNYEREFGSLLCLFSPLDAFCDDNTQQECLPLLMVPWSWTPRFLNQEIMQDLLHYRPSNLCYSVFIKTTQIASNQLIGQGQADWVAIADWRWDGLSIIMWALSEGGQQGGRGHRGAAWERLTHSLLALDMKGSVWKWKVNETTELSDVPRELQPSLLASGTLFRILTFKGVKENYCSNLISLWSFDTAVRVN